MKFDIVSTIYYMKLSISNNKEIFTRDSFSIVYASYNKDNDRLHTLMYSLKLYLQIKLKT